MAEQDTSPRVSLFLWCSTELLSTRAPVFPMVCVDNAEMPQNSQLRSPLTLLRTLKGWSKAVPCSAGLGLCEVVWLPGHLCAAWAQGSALLLSLVHWIGPLLPVTLPGARHNLPLCSH